MKTYAECVKDIMQEQGISQRRVAGLIGIDEAVLSKRMRPDHKATREALIVVNLVRDLACAGDRTRAGIQKFLEPSSFLYGILASTTQPA